MGNSYSESDEYIEKREKYQATYDVVYPTLENRHKKIMRVLNAVKSGAISVEDGAQLLQASYTVYTPKYGP